MNDVCSVELLKNAVASGLSADEETALHAHLEHCETCCAEIERLAGGEAWQQEAAALLPTDELDLAAPDAAAWSDVDFGVEHLRRWRTAASQNRTRAARASEPRQDAEFD